MKDVVLDTFDKIRWMEAYNFQLQHLKELERKRIDSNLMDTTSLEPAYQVLYRLENLLKGDK